MLREQGRHGICARRDFYGARWSAWAAVTKTRSVPTGPSAPARRSAARHTPALACSAPPSAHWRPLRRPEPRSRAAHLAHLDLCSCCFLKPHNPFRNLLSFCSPPHFQVWFPTSFAHLWWGGEVGNQTLPFAQCWPGAAADSESGGKSGGADCLGGVAPLCPSPPRDGASAPAAAARSAASSRPGTAPRARRGCSHVHAFWAPTSKAALSEGAVAAPPAPPPLNAPEGFGRRERLRWRPSARRV